MNRLVKKSSVAIISLLILTVSLFSGCIQENEDMGSLTIGQDAPSFTANLKGGKTFNMDDHKDEVVLVNFWATWCPPCVGEMPELQKISDEGLDGVTIICINCGEDRSTVDSFVDEKGFNLNIGYDPDGSIAAKYPSEYIPYTVIVKNGKVEAEFVGVPEDPYNAYRDTIIGLMN